MSDSLIKIVMNVFCVFLILAYNITFRYLIAQASANMNSSGVAYSFRMSAEMLLLPCIRLDKHFKVILTEILIKREDC